MPIDDRAHLPFSIEAPAPLPHVSRRALANVRDALPIPKHCPHCGEDVALVENSVIYNGKTYGKWPYIYRCAPCDAYVGLHPHTDIPLGTLAKKPLRKARIAAKAHFITMCRANKWGRDTAYAWLADAMGITAEECHFGMFDIDQAEQAGVSCLANTPPDGDQIS